MSLVRSSSPALNTVVGNSLVWDNHGCMPLRADASFLPELERYRSAGVNIVSLNVGYGEMDLTEHLSILSFMRSWISQFPDRYLLVQTADDVDRCVETGILGVVFDVEGMCPVQSNPTFVQTFYELGVRWMLIAYNRNNLAGGGCLDQNLGLTDIGRGIIDEMERVGMLLCLSHASRPACLEAFEYSRQPVIFSHSNPSGNFEHPRNVDDDLIRACARTGGVFGLSGIGKFVGPGDSVVDRYVEQLRHVIDLVGPDHVGISLDYVFDTSDLDSAVRANPSLYTPGTETGATRRTVAPEAISRIADAMTQFGLNDPQIRGVLGGNWMRLARQVWK